MAHGAPDYSNVRKEEFVYRVDDMAELSARLHKGVSLERRGETVFFETFEHGLTTWTFTTSGTGGSTKLTADEFVSKGFGVELIGGSSASLSARMFYRLPLLGMTKVGFECRVKQFTNINALTIYIDYYDGTTLHTGYFRYFPISEVIQVRKSDNTFETVLSDIASPTSGELFDFIKIVIDTNTDKYVRGMYNDNTVDLSDYDLYQIADASARAMVVVATVHSVSGQNGKAIIDNIIVTRNET